MGSLHVVLRGVVGCFVQACPCAVTACIDNNEACDDANNTDNDGCNADCSLSAVVQVAVGDVHACAQLNTGAVRCWGLGVLGSLGYGNQDTIGDDENPAEAGDVNVGATVSQLTAGNGHVCALLETRLRSLLGLRGFRVSLATATRTISETTRPRQRLVMCRWAARWCSLTRVLATPARFSIQAPCVVGGVVQQRRTRLRKHNHRRRRRNPRECG